MYYVQVATNSTELVQITQKGRFTLVIKPPDVY